MYKGLTRIPIIDSHVHVFPPRLSRAVRRWFNENAWGFRYEGTVESLLQAQFDNGISGLVLLCYAHRPGIADGLNEFVGSLIRKFPHTAGFATIHPEDSHPEDILKRAFEKWGLCGLKLHCHVQRTAPDDPLLFPVYKTLIELGGFLNMHAGRGPALEGYGIDVKAITGADRVENVMRRYPDLSLIVPHLGFDESDRFYSLLESYTNLYLDTTMMLADFFDEPVRRDKLVQYADRILYGSDYPHIPYEMEKEVKALIDMDLGEGPTGKILWENAVRLFPIDPA